MKKKGALVVALGNKKQAILSLPEIAFVNKRTYSLRKSLMIAYLNQTDDNCQEAKSQLTEKILWRMAVLQLILYIRIKGTDTRRFCIKPTGSRLRGWEKAKLGEVSGIG